MRRARSFVSRVRNELKLDTREMRAFVVRFQGEMDRGLRGRPRSLQMIPTYVRRPTGAEKGSFLALDLGGTNFRVLRVELKGRGRLGRTASHRYRLEPRLLSGSGDALFGFIASRVKDFVMAVGGSRKGRDERMAFTFSFPVAQSGKASGKLLVWTKGFKVKGVVGRDVVELLRRALRKKGLGHLEISALVNDTVGTLACGAYTHRACDTGVIIGTGTNACYAEEVRNIRRIRSGSGAGEMIVNTEWGDFDKFDRLAYDLELDRLSENPGRQLLEKTMSGKYLGEVVRIILDHAAKEGAIADPRGAFGARGSISSADLSEIEADRSRSLVITGRLLRRLGLSENTLAERRLVKGVSAAVSLRGARFAAAALAAVITKNDPRLSSKHTVAVDGSVYEKHPAYARQMRSALGELFGRRSRKIHLVTVKDGSGTGAAILAAVG